MEQLSLYFILFIIYSFMGWVMEVVCSLVKFKRFVNRGFLLGPICPIYGCGVIGITLLIGNDTSSIPIVFLKSIVVCSILEYSTSYIMEKMFNARWWDYSKKKFNINGRICLSTMLPFGILGTLVVCIVHPFFIKLISLLNPTHMIILSIILFIIFIIDNIVSFSIMNKIKLEIKKQIADNTETIKKHVMEWIEEKSVLYRHIKNAYPKFKIRKNKKD